MPWEPGLQAWRFWWDEDRPEWMSRAACRGQSEVFFVEGRGTEPYQARLAAKAICDGCPVAEPCEEYAVAIRARYGIWNGKTPTERGMR